MESRKKILVTGGAGFIGSNFVNKYSSKYDIYVVDSLTYAGSVFNIADAIPEINFYKVDITDTFLEEVFDNISPDIVVNFAAETHVDTSIHMPKLFTSTNIIGTQNLLGLSLIHNVEKYIQISTDEVYGHLGKNDPSFTELTPLSPRSPYSATKASADLIVQAYNQTYGLNTCITRCSNNFGPCQHHEKLIPKIILKALNNKQIPIYGNGENIRDWIYVEDHIDGIDAVIENGVTNNVYNFGGNNSEMSNIDICKKILDYLDKPHSLIEFVEDRPGHDFRYSIDYTKANNDLGWEPKFNFDDAITKTIEFYKKRTF
jgi:dTDP-glucose 4,6-dehydratase